MADLEDYYTPWKRKFVWWPKKLSNGMWVWWRYVEQRFFIIGCIAGTWCEEYIRVDSNSAQVHVA